MPVDALIFDLDGTLVDTAPDLWAATNHVMRRLGRRPLQVAEVRAFVGHGAKALIARGCEATGEAVKADELDSLYHEFIAYYTAHIADASKPYPGLLTFLDKARDSGFAMAVCTNKLEGLSVRLIEALGLMPYFGAIVGPDTIGIAKPDPAPLREALRRIGREGGSGVMFGDSETDIRTAQNAGMPVVAVSFGYTPLHVSAFGPTVIIDHYNEAWAALDTLAGPA
jgi:phosphoglycolate phosphatase